MTCRKAAAIWRDLRNFLMSLLVIRSFSELLVRLTYRQVDRDQKDSFPKEFKVKSWTSVYSLQTGKEGAFIFGKVSGPGR